MLLPYILKFHLFLKTHFRADLLAQFPHFARINLVEFLDEFFIMFSNKECAIMCKQFVFASIVFALCTACTTPPKAPYPTGPERKLNLDKRPVPPKSVTPAASVPAKK